MPYSYSLSYLTRTRTIEPKSIGKVVVVREEGEAFFREKLTGSIEVTGEDYDFLIDATIFAIECCQEVSLYIYQTCASGTELFWEGYFTLQDIEWDYDNTQATIKKVTVRDQYNDIFTNWQKEISWLGYEGSRRPGMGVPPVRQFKPFRQNTPAYADYNPSGSNLFPRGFDFNESILFLVKKTMEGTSGEGIEPTSTTNLSTFFTAATNPVTQKPNYLKNIILMHLSDAKRPNASNPATVGNVTLKSVLSELKTMFNAYWYIDDTGKFRIEHITFFAHYSYAPSALTIDLTLPEFKEAMSGRNRMSYQTEKLKGIEGVEWSINAGGYDSVSEIYTGGANPSNVEFSGGYMWYGETCVPKDEKGEKTTQFQSVSMFCTDWRTIAFKPDTIPDEGWALAHVENPNLTESIVNGWLPIANYKIMNGCLSATRLFFDFMRYDLSFAYGMFSAEKEKAKPKIGNAEISEKPMRAKSVKRIKTFVPVELGQCCGSAYDFSGYIKHPLADNCVIEQVEYDLINQSVEITVQSSNACSDVPFPDYEEPIDAPPAGCPPNGQLLRSELVRTYRESSATQNIIVSVFTDYYADGTCGEYQTTKETRSSTPKRPNGPR